MVSVDVQRHVNFTLKALSIVGFVVPVCHITTTLTKGYQQWSFCALPVCSQRLRVGGGGGVEHDLLVVEWSARLLLLDRLGRCCPVAAAPGLGSRLVLCRRLGWRGHHLNA